MRISTIAIVVDATKEDADKMQGMDAVSMDGMSAISLFPPMWAMFLVDIVMICLGIIGTTIILRKWSTLRPSGATLGVSLILFGLWIGISLYILDMYSMTLLVRAIGMMPAMSFMEQLHIKYSWYFNVASATFVTAGLFLTI